MLYQAAGHRRRGDQSAGFSAVLVSGGNQSPLGAGQLTVDATGEGDHRAERARGRQVHPSASPAWAKSGKVGDPLRLVFWIEAQTFSGRTRSSPHGDDRSLPRRGSRQQPRAHRQRRSPRGLPGRRLRGRAAVDRRRHLRQARRPRHLAEPLQHQPHRRLPRRRHHLRPAPRLLARQGAGGRRALGRRRGARGHGRRGAQARHPRPPGLGHPPRPPGHSTSPPPKAQFLHRVRLRHQQLRLDGARNCCSTATATSTTPTPTPTPPSSPTRSGGSTPSISTASASTR